MGKGVCCVAIIAGKGAYDRPVMLGDVSSWGFQNWITNWLIIWDLFLLVCPKQAKKKGGDTIYSIWFEIFSFLALSHIQNVEPWASNSGMSLILSPDNVNFGIDVSIAISQWCEVVVPGNDCIPLWRLENASIYIHIHICIYIYIVNIFWFVGNYVIAFGVWASRYVL